MMQEEITESELNSEVELLNGTGLAAEGCARKWTANKMALLAAVLLVSPTEEVEIAKAVRDLGKHLKVEPLRKTNIISVTFESSDPELAARVLNSLGSLYLEKHLQVHRPSGEFTFFDQETEQLRRGLDTAEGRLNDFTRQRGVVSAPVRARSYPAKSQRTGSFSGPDPGSIAETGATHRSPGATGERPFRPVSPPNSEPRTIRNCFSK